MPFAALASQLAAEVQKVLVTELPNDGSFLEPGDPATLRALAAQDLPLLHACESLQCLAIVDEIVFDAETLKAEIHDQDKS